MHLPIRSPLAILSCVVATCGLCPAAISVTNGGFGVNNQNARIVDGGGWFESTTTDNWTEGSWSNANPVTFPSGSGMGLLFDGGTSSLGYVYQSLGTVSAADIAAGTITLTADFAEKLDGSTNGARFDVLTGSFAGAATGNDILSAGTLTSLFSRTMSASDQGLTAAGGDQSRATGIAVGTIDISGLSEGSQIWLRIGESRLPSNLSGDLILDNVVATVVPEPSSLALLAGACGFVMLRRRRA